MAWSAERARSQPWRTGAADSARAGRGEEWPDGPTFADACCIAAIFVGLLAAATLGLAATYLMVVHF